jgi:Leucine-rich repeat (LRR) protein
MCEKVGQGCACRLALTLSRMEALRELDVSHNTLRVLPDAVASLPRLRVLSAAGNALTSLPALPPGGWGELEELDLRDNALRLLPIAALEALPFLRKVWLAGNALDEPALSAALSSRLARAGILQDLEPRH